MYEKFEQFIPVCVMALALAMLAGCVTTGVVDTGPGPKIGAPPNQPKTSGIMAIQAPNLGKSGGALKKVMPAMARIAEVGGNTVCFDLHGFNRKGTKLDPAGVEMIGPLAARASGQRMGVMVRVLGDSKTPRFRRNAVRTAAEALRDQGGALYWIDGPDAGALAKEFKRIAPNLVVAAPENGDLRTIYTPRASGGDRNVLLAGALPDFENAKVNFVLDGRKADYQALDAALRNPVELAPWTPDNSILSQAERDEGFIALFNGRNFDGWWFLGDNPNGFRVTRDGVLEWAERGARGLYTRDRYDDFILRLEWKIAKDGNNGIWLRAPRGARQSRIGIEFQMQGDYDVPEHGKSNTAAVYDVLPPLVKAAKPDGEWNDLEITFDGARYKAILNGHLVQDLDFDDYPELRYRLRKGFICITDHGDYAAFRNIRLKKL